MVDLRREFSHNLPRREKSLVRRVLEKTKKIDSEAAAEVFEDSRGPNVTRLRHRQIRLSDNRACLVARYDSGESVKSLAQAFGIHRNTVTIHTREARERRSGSR